MKFFIHILAFLIVISIVVSHTAQSQEKKEVIDSINSLSYQFIVSHLHQSISIFSENAATAKSINYALGEGISLSQLGIAHYLRGNLSKSTECYVRAFQIFEDKKDYKNLAGAFGEYGYQLKQRDLPKGIHFMQLAIALAEENNLGDDLKCKLYDNYGVLKEMHCEYDSALYLYTRSLLMKTQRGDSVGIPYSLNKIASLKALEQKYEEAHSYMLRSDQYRAQEKDDFSRAENLSLWGDIFLKEGKLDSSIYRYKESMRLARSLDYEYLQEYCLERLSEACKLKKDFATSLDYYRAYSTLKDSTLNRQTRATIAELEIDYETAKKDKLIAGKEFELKQRTLLLIITVGFMIFLILVFLWIYKDQMQKRKQMKHDMEVRSRLKEAELENKISAEKLRISRELHDNIGSRLTFVISSLDNLTFANKANAISSMLANLSSFSRETLNDLRSTVWAMKNEDGTIADLLLKIHELVQKLAENDFHVDIAEEQNLSETLHLSSVQMLNLFRIVQEALQNSIKHSHATKILIRFDELSDGFSLRIEDNGQGFDCSSFSAGNGISHMESRCKEAAGNFKLQSGLKGTTVECRIHCI